MKNVDYDVEAFDEKGFGAFMMDKLAAQMGEEGEYITMVGSMTQESHNNWADAAVARQQEKYPKMKLVADKRVGDDSDSEIAYQKTKELIKKYPNLKGILGTSPSTLPVRPAPSRNSASSANSSPLVVPFPPKFATS